MLRLRNHIREIGLHPFHLDVLARDRDENPKDEMYNFYIKSGLCRENPLKSPKNNDWAYRIRITLILFSCVTPKEQNLKEVMLKDYSKSGRIDPSGSILSGWNTPFSSF